MKIQHYHLYDEIIQPFYKCIGFCINDNLYDKIEEVNKVRIWCEENFGKIDNDNFTPRWIDNLTWGEIRFREEKDFNWFLLRWIQ